MIGIVSRLTDQKGFDLIAYMMERMCEQGIQFVVLGTGEQKYEDMFRWFAGKYPDRVSANIYYSEMSHRIYASMTHSLCRPFSNHADFHSLCHCVTARRTATSSSCTTRASSARRGRTAPSTTSRWRRSSGWTPHNFVPGAGTVADAEARRYTLRGVRTGEQPPPLGYTADDFRIPTLEEVLRAFPDVPMNIEIKGRSDEDRQSFLDNADRLVALLRRVPHLPLVVVSFDQLMRRSTASTPRSRTSRLPRASPASRRSSPAGVAPPGRRRCRSRRPSAASRS